MPGKEQIAEAMSLLEDDSSRKVFTRRMLYAQTGKMEHLLEMVMDSFREQKGSEYKSNTELLLLAKTVHKIVEEGGKARIVIWGAGNGSVAPQQLIYEYGFTILDNIEGMFCDNNPSLWGTVYANHNPYKRWPIVPPNDIKQFAQDENCFIVIGVYSRSAAVSIFEQCLSMGFSRDRIVMQHDTYEYLLGRIYFEDNIIPHSEHEVFVDTGAFDMTDSQEFIKWCGGKYDRIIAFEADRISYHNCRNAIERSNMERVELVCAGLYSCDTKLRFLSAPSGEYGGSRFDSIGEDFVDAVSLDSYLDGKPVTFIKMDIEGAELEALKGAAATIRRYKPKLALSVYHRPWDVVELPLYIKSLNPDYRFYLRHHKCGIWDTVLYAV